MSNLPLTLLQMQGASQTPPAADRATLVLIDLQEEYRHGRLTLDNIDAAVAEAARVLAWARAHGVPVVHVQHAVGPDAPIFDPTRPSFAIMPEVAPREGEAVVVKARPNAFVGTDLDARLRALGRREIVTVGAMTHTCVSATACAALDLGYRTTIVAAACATRDLPSITSERIAAADVHLTALAALADAFAIVLPDAAALIDA